MIIGLMGGISTSDGGGESISPFLSTAATDLWVVI